MECNLNERRKTESEVVEENEDGNGVKKTVRGRRSSECEPSLNTHED